jgi:nucleotide-binding universal stress UspA family protein
MRIVAGFLRSPEGRAALDRAIEETRLRVGAQLLVVHSMRGGERDELKQVLTYREEFEQLEQRLKDEGVDYRLVEYARGNAPAEDLLQAAKDEDADLIVIGIRRRSPVGKLVLGSNAQDVLLHADCAVLAVKAEATAD